MYLGVIGVEKYFGEIMFIVVLQMYNLNKLCVTSAGRVNIQNIAIL